MLHSKLHFTYVHFNQLIIFIFITTNTCDITYTIQYAYLYVLAH